MSGGRNGKGGNGPLGILLLLALGLWLGWKVLQFVFSLFSGLALSFFLALDASYGRLGDPVVGYALLGLGLGAAAGAVAARRRFRLGPLVLAGAVGGLLVLLGAVYFGRLST